MTGIRRTALRVGTLVGLAVLTGCERSAPAVPAAVAAPVEREGYAITPDSVQLWYRVVGAGKQTIVAGAANYFAKSLDALVTPDRRVVSYDIRGRGRTDSVPPSKMGIVEFDAGDVEVIRQAVGAESIAVVGWSGGALSAFQYAARHAEHVSHLLLITPVGPRWVPWWDDMRNNAVAKADTAANARLAARVKAGEFANNEVGLCRESARLGLRTNWVDSTQWHLAPDVCDSPNELPGRYGDFVPRLLAKLGKYDFRGDLAKVKARTLLIHGEMDNPPLGGSQEWVAGIPGARLLVMRGVGHWPFYERPAETLAAIGAFLDGGWPAGAEPEAGAKP